MKTDFIYLNKHQNNLFFVTWLLCLFKGGDLFIGIDCWGSLLKNPPISRKMIIRKYQLKRSSFSVYRKDRLSPVCIMCANIHSSLERWGIMVIFKWKILLYRKKKRLFQQSWTLMVFYIHFLIEFIFTCSPCSWQWLKIFLFNQHCILKGAAYLMAI